MKKLKIGIIGVGRLGYEHACNIANRVPGSELVAIADTNFDRAKQIAEELGVTAVYNDPKVRLLLQRFESERGERAGARECLPTELLLRGSELLPESSRAH